MSSGPLIPLKIIQGINTKFIKYQYQQFSVYITCVLVARGGGGRKNLKGKDEISCACKVRKRLARVRAESENTALYIRRA